MLGPFRISNLPPRSPRRPTAGPNTFARWLNTGGAVVSVHGDKYEQWIQAVPEAKLKYRDADKDLITVGSKQELEDRLSEPIRKLTRTTASQQRRGTNVNAVPLRPASPEMHVFEIDPIEAAVQLWQTIEHKPSEEKLMDVLGLDGAAPEPKSDRSPPANRSDLTLEEKQAVYFRNSLPPQISSNNGSPTNPDTQSGLVVHEQSSSSMEPSNVLTPTGILQAQKAGEQLRARLGNPGPRIDRANAVNSWANYSQLSEPPAQLQLGDLFPMSKPSDSLSTWGTSSSKSHLRPSSTIVEPSLTPSLLRPNISGSDHDNDAHLSEAVHGSLLPAFYENVQASLAKLSPEMTTLSGVVMTTDKNDQPASNDSDGEIAATGDEKGEAAETTLSKMVFTSIREMAEILAKMNSQFDAQLTPKLVSERLKSKDKLLPTHRQDTVRDLFTIRRAIEEFALEVAETKQTFARLEDAKVFPENTNMVDFTSITAATYAFGRLVRSMDDMIIAARRGMLPAQLEDGESKFHTPRRLARHGYEDVWSVTITSLPSSFSRVDVRNLVYEARREHCLKTIEIRGINLREGPPRTAEIVIEGTLHAKETWNSLISFPIRSLRLHLSDRQVNLARKHYPEVYRCSNGLPKEKGQSVAATPSRADIDVARLKALQDRRAAWRKEFKARTQSVRFTEPVKVVEEQSSTSKNEKAPSVPKQPPIASASVSDTSNKPVLLDGALASNSVKRSQAHDSALRTSRSDCDLKSVPRRSLRPVQSQNFTPNVQPPAYDHGIPKDRHAIYHSIKYPPGPFPPAPPGISAALPSPMVTQPTFSLPPIASLQSSFSLPPIAHLDQGRSQPFHLPALSPPSPNSESSRNNKKLPPLIPPQVKYPQLNHYSSDATTGPLPSFPALEPIRSQSLKHPDDISKQQTIPGDWPDPEDTENESSGAFFRRMMGRSPAPADTVSPMLSPVLGTSQPSGGTRPPVSPISSTPGLGRSSTVTLRPPAQTTVRRSATVATAPSERSLPAKSASGPWSRRPYSHTFDGAGRSHQYRSREAAPERAARISGADLARPVSMPPRQDHTAPIAVALDPETRPDWARVQYCVNQLKELGYGDVHNGGMDRLAMYAQLADGDLEVTIDLIEEERQAWNEKEDGASPVGAVPE